MDSLEKPPVAVTVPIRIITWFINILRFNYTFIKLVNKSLNKVGYHIMKVEGPDRFPFDIDKDFKTIYKKTDDYTQTSVERMYALYQGVEYIVRKEITGDLVECGVWKGGSSMIAALTLKKNKDIGRKIFLYDTFTGMSEPTVKDVGANDGTRALDYWGKQTKKGITYWDYESFDRVKKNMFSTGYPKEKIIFVKGKVEETIPKIVPKKIALLRLDTDWYESTYHELVYLYPFIVPGGILLIDDYGHWKGAREAVDQYFRENNITMLLNRIDYTGRIGIKI